MKKMILILDDEEALTELISQDLRARGYDAYGLVSKAKGLAWSKLYKPDLIISDINSPNMNGFEFLSKLRSNNKTKDTPVIIVSGTCSGGEYNLRLISLGANACLAKPLVDDDLLKEIKRLIG